MMTKWRRRLAARRLTGGDGSPLKRLRWWHVLTGRSLLHLDLTAADGRPVRYSVDVRYHGDGEDGVVRARLYRDGRQHAVSKVPAVFPVEGGEIEVATSGFGVRRAHYVTDGGAEHQLTPDPRSGEGRRARFQRDHPSAGVILGAVSVAVLVVGIGVNVLQLLEPVSAIPPIAENVGVFVSPIHLPLWLNIALGLGAAFASWERALRLRYHWLLDAGGN